MNEDSATRSRRLRMEDVIDLERLCIRLDRCLTVVPGPIDPAVVSTLDERGYDQAPVYDAATHRYWGIVETSYLRSLLESGQPLRADDPVVRDEGREFHVGAFVTIFDLLDRMAAQRAFVVIRDSDVTEYGHVEFIWGLFTISDLNRHAVRSAIYHLLADVESGLAKWLEAHAPDPWEWLKHLGEEQQARVLGYWELSKRQGVDVGPIAALTLAQLVNVIARDDRTAKGLGYSSRSQFAKAAGGLARVRNRVMHPVRPLVLAQEDVGEVHRSVLLLEELRERIEALLARGNAA